MSQSDIHPTAGIPYFLVAKRIRWGSAFATAALVFGALIANPTWLNCQQTSIPPQSGGVAAREPQFHLIRSISGTKGSQNGDQYVIADPRTVFYLPEDKQVIVYCEWEGPLGQHHIEGYWKNPDGKVVVISDFNYEAKQKRFAAFWTLLLSETMPAGIWALEARVDGEVTGVHNFQLAVAPRPAPAAPSRPLLGPNEVYKLALPATVSIEKLDSQRHRLNLGSGFILNQDLIATSFENIESASLVRVILPSGASLEFDGAGASNRREDWAVLRMATPNSASLVPAKPGSWEVGDRCFSLDSPQEGSRTIVDGNITGTHKFPDVGDRLNLNFGVSRFADGSPLLNEYGETIGLVATSSLVPGLGTLAVLREGSLGGYPGNLYGEGVSGPQLGIPISLLRLPSQETAPTTFAEMTKSGLFPESLVKTQNILYGTLARSIRHTGEQMEAVDSKFEFQRKDPQVNVLITWHMESKLKSTAFLKVFDIENRLLGTTKPLKLKLSKGQIAYSSWTFDAAHLPAGIYRVDLVVDPDTVWRSFFRVAD